MTIIGGQNLTSSQGAMFYVSDGNGAMSVTFSNLNIAGDSIVAPNEVTGIWAVGSSSASTVHILGCYVSAFSYGGIYAQAFNVDVQDTEIFANQTPESGGGIFVDSASHNLTVSRTTVDTNGAANYGGGIEYQGVGASSVVGSTMYLNDATLGGGGIDIEGEGDRLRFHNPPSCTIHAKATSPVVEASCRSPVITRSISA